MSHHRFLTAAIEKAEKQTDGSVRFEGIFSSEALDCQGDIVAKEATRKAVDGWVAKNLREMHQPIAVGKAIDFEFLPDGRAKLKGFVSAGAPDTCAKVMDGTLAGLSIAGPPPKKFETVKVNGGKTARRVLEYELSEISLVDNPANPDALGINILKAAGIEPETVTETTTTEAAPNVNRFAEALKKAVPAPEPAKEEKPAEKTDEPVAKADPPKPDKGALRKFMPYGDEIDDVQLGVEWYRLGQYLLACETSEGEQDAEQVATITSALELIGKFIGAEGMELAAQPIAASAPKPEVAKAEVTPPWVKDLAVWIVEEIRPSFKKSDPSGFTPEDGEQLTVAIGEEVRSQTSGVIKAVDEVKGAVAQTAADLKVFGTVLQKIADAPMPIGAPVKHGAPTMGADGRPVGLTPELERFALARAAALVPDPASAALLRQVARNV